MGTKVLDEAPSTISAGRDEALRTTLLENDEVVVVSATYPPGSSLPIHDCRFPNVAYVVDGGIVETRDFDGTVECYDVHPGETLWSAAAHAQSARNKGNSFLRMVEVESKHATATAESSESKIVVLSSEDLNWNPDPLDPRRRSAMLFGDPTLAGPYASRFAAPAGYIIGLHMHPEEDEQLTVLSGTVRWSTGEPGSGEPEYTLTAGGFALAPAGTPHRIAVIEDSVIQMQGIGPRTYLYLNPADDPRQKA